jgi:hypothetical protein
VGCSLHFPSIGFPPPFEKAFNAFHLEILIPDLQVEMNEKTLQQLMVDAGWTTWPEALCGTCLRYLWGSRLHLVPEDWRNFVEEAKVQIPQSRYFTYFSTPCSSWSN